MKKKTASKKSTVKKTSAKKSPAKKASLKTVKKPVLYVHSTDKGPQLCLKTKNSDADGVILPTAQQKQLNSLYKEWEKTGASNDFMKFPKAAKWMKKLITAFNFSEITAK